MGFGTIVVVTGIIFYLFTCAAVIDIARKDFGSIQMKALWGFTALIPFIGVVIYLIFGFRKGKRPGASNDVVPSGD